MSPIRVLVLPLAIAAVEVAPIACSTGNPAQPQPGNLPPEGGVSSDGGADAPGQCVTAPLPDGGPVKVTGHVTNGMGDANAPIANAMVAVEYGGVYLDYCDRAHASPYYVFGAYSAADGSFSINVKEGQLGFHSFATGFYYGHATLDTTQGKDVTIKMEPLPPAQAKPAVTNAGFGLDGGSVAPGQPLTFSANVRAASSADPLSDELLLVEPTQSWSVELDPPSVGRKDNFPDGTWNRTFSAPRTPATYTYYFSATTGGCVTTDVQTFTLKVQ